MGIESEDHGLINASKLPSAIFPERIGDRTPHTPTKDFLDESPTETSSSELEMVQTHIDTLEGEQRSQAFEASIVLLRNALQDVPNYAVFGSGAMYLMAHKYNIDDWPKKSPGDVDIAVTDMQSFKKIHRGLKDTPGCHIHEQGLVTSSLDGAKILSGNCEVTVPGLTEKVIVPFEIFANTSLIPDQYVANATEVEGIRSLTINDLKESYKNIHSFESVVKETLEGRIELLLRPDVRHLFQDYLEAREAGQGSKIRKRFSNEQMQDHSGLTRKVLLEGLLHDTELSTENIEEAYDILEQIEQNNPDNIVETAVNHENLAGLLAHGLKQKVKKRDRNIREIHRLTAMKFTTSDYEPPVQDYPDLPLAAK